MSTQNLGMAGGRDFSALYFVGLSDNDNLLYLDPHYVHDAIPLKYVTSPEHMSDLS